MSESSLSSQVLQYFESILQLNNVTNILRVAITVLVAFILGLLIYFTYKLSCKAFAYDSEFGLVLIIVPLVVSLLLTVIGTNIARAFSLAGALSIIRFRSTLINPKEIVFIFFGMGSGFIAGTGLYLPALVFVLFASVIIIIYTAFTMDRGKDSPKTLKIAVPENINYEGLFDDVLEEYTSAYVLSAVRLISAGTIVELNYNLKLKDEAQTKEFIDGIRTLNQNFTIQLTQFIPATRR